MHKKVNIRREKLKEKWGGIIPTSVLFAESISASVGYIDLSRKLQMDKEKERISKSPLSRVAIDEGYTAEIKKTWAMSKKTAHSIFPQNILKVYLGFYSEKGDTVFDPFCGHNSRMQTTYLLNRSYIGVDISKLYMKLNRIVAKKLNSQKRFVENKSEIKLIEADSRNLYFQKDESVDYIITSPPFYKQEIYTDESEQLWRCESYEKFIIELKKIVKECYRILKNNKFMTWNVADWRIKDEIIGYHIDFIRICKEVGFNHHDTNIMVFPSSVCAIFHNQIEERGFFPKRHEYLITLRKGSYISKVKKRSYKERDLAVKASKTTQTSIL